MEQARFVILQDDATSTFYYCRVAATHQLAWSPSSHCLTSVCTSRVRVRVTSAPKVTSHGKKRFVLWARRMIKSMTTSSHCTVQNDTDDILTPSAPLLFFFLLPFRHALATFSFVLFLLLIHTFSSTLPSAQILSHALIPFFCT